MSKKKKEVRAWAVVDETGVLENMTSKLDVFSSKDVAERTARFLDRCEVKEVTLIYGI